MVCYSIHLGWQLYSSIMLSSFWLPVLEFWCFVGLVRAAADTVPTKLGNQTIERVRKFTKICHSSIPTAFVDGTTPYTLPFRTLYRPRLAK